MLKIVDHPLIQDNITRIRDKNTGSGLFRKCVDDIGSLMAFEALKDIELTEVEVMTPLCTCKSKKIADPIVLVPILRAGLGMVNGFERLLPDAKIAHIGMYRDEETLEPHPYFEKYPSCMDKAHVIIVDPMLATGGSSVAAIDMVKKQGAKDIRLVCLVGVKQGVEFVEKHHPDVDIYLGVLDDHLNEHGYIVPGLGDAGDRIFGTD